jgi:hypothetical protein
MPRTGDCDWSLPRVPASGGWNPRPHRRLTSYAEANPRYFGQFYRSGYSRYWSRIVLYSQDPSRISGAETLQLEYCSYTGHAGQCHARCDSLATLIGDRGV